MEFKIKNKNGATLYTAKTYVEEDIVIVLDESLIPSGTLEITENGEHNVEQYEKVNVNIESGGQDYTIEDALIERTITSYANNRVTIIGENAFRQWTTLEECDFQNVTVVNKTAFYGCAGLKNILMPSVTTIGEQAFNGCSNLEKIKCDLVATLGGQAIRSCKNLKYFYSSKLKNIGSGCFADCTNLVAIIISSDTVCPLSVTNAFNSTPIISGTGFIYVSDNLVESYKSATNWSAYAEQIKPISELPQEIKEDLGL